MTALLEKICKILSSKKAEDIICIDISKKTSIADYFVIASGKNITHIRTLGEFLIEKLEKEDIRPLRNEGLREGQWGVIDYGDIIVHIFDQKTRSLYKLDKLWESGNNLTKYED